MLSLSLVHSPVLSLTLRYFLLFPLSCSLQISVCITIFITSSIIRALFAFCLPCSHTIIVRRLLFATFCRENAVCSFLNTFQKVGIQTLRSKLCDPKLTSAPVLRLKSATQFGRELSALENCYFLFYSAFPISPNAFGCAVSLDGGSATAAVSAAGLMAQKVFTGELLEPQALKAS